MVIPKIKESEDLINKVANLTINAVNENDLINEVMNLTINVRNKNNLVNKVANVTVNNAGNNLNQVNTRDVQFQFADDQDKKSHQNLLSSWMIGI